MLAPVICWLRPDVYTQEGKVCETCQRLLCRYNDNNRKEIKTK